MVEARAKQTSQRGKRTDVAAQIAAVGRVVAVGLNHHGHRVPSHIGAQTFFNFQVARRALFVVGLNGVDIAGGGRKRHVNAFLAGMFQHLLQQKVRALGAFGLDDGGQGVHPLSRFLVVDIAADTQG